MVDDRFEYGIRIPEFPNYEVTNYGRVINCDTRKEMTLSPTQQGELTVGLHRDREQFRRSVKVLVAEAFVPGRSEIFNTPILLDGDRYNLNANNIAWRPRWFAWQYTRQFVLRPEKWFVHISMVDQEGNRYDNIWEAATATGSLCSQIEMSLVNGTRVFPHGNTFRRL